MDASVPAWHALRVVFSGFPPDAFAWYEGLERDNSRDYFTRTRETYESVVRGELEALFDALTEEFGGTPRLFRQHRDIRFSPDKSPYKDRTYGVLVGAPSAFYAELSARGLYAGSGYHVLMRDQLDRFRAAVDAEATGRALVAAVDAVEAAGLEIAGPSLKTAPRGYPREHPRIELLRRKALFAGRRMAPGRHGIGPDTALEHVASTWRAAAPLNGWLHEHVGATTLEEPDRWRRR
jgi:uncharacterized protein (TIGR02453 family)